MNQYGYSVDVVREHNIKLISRLLYQKPMSCKEMSVVLGLSETAIKKNIIQLLDEGIVIVAEDDPNEKKNVGRQHIRYAINSRYGAFVLIDLSHRHDSFFIKDFSGKTLYFEKVKFGTKMYQKDLEELSDKIEKKLKELNIEVKGIAVAVPGQVEESVGELIISSRFDGTDVTNIKAFFKARFNINQIYVKNDLRFCVFGDPAYLERSENTIALYVYVGYGISCAIVSNGKIISGIRDVAGEIGQSICPDGIDLHTHCAVDSFFAKFNKSSFDELLSAFHSSKEVKDDILKSAEIFGGQIQAITDALGCVDVVVLGEIKEFGEEYLNTVKARINNGNGKFEKQVSYLDYKSMREYGMLEVLKNHVTADFD
ncbi:MAG: ROK family transcriptional regulator [Clostridia bacterium]|nr:ROK family transcriptional regulator [Clostridia bacterium]